MNGTRTRWLRLGVLLVLVAWGAGIASAQESQQPYEAPVIEFGEEGIGLVEAVRLTLEHDPNIKLQDAQTGIREGALQQQTGVFDLTLAANASYEYREQELRESRKEIEREKRQALDESIREFEQFEGQARRTLAALRAIQQGGPISIPDNPGLEAQLLLIQAAIDQTDDPATKQRLQNLFDRVVQENIDRITEELESVLADLDEARLRRRQLGDVPDDEVFYTGQFDLAFDKQTRSGIFLSPFFTGKWQGENFKGKRKAEEFGGKGIQDLFSFRVGFDVNVPLARGFGDDATGAAEDAARIDLEASRFALEHQAARSVLQTALAYWDLRSAQRIVDVSQRSAELQEILLETTDALIEAEEMPRVELSRVQASLARSRSRLEDARRDLYRARVNLATTMGVTATEAEETLPTARDPFPDVPETIPDEAALGGLMEDGVEQRRDLMAAQSLERSGRVLARAAQLDQKPLLDVAARTWFTSLGERTVSEALDRWVGPSLDLRVRFEKPLGNNFFEGRHRQARADLRRRSIDAMDLERVIQLGVVRELRSLRDAADAVRLARESVGYYEETIEAEIQKLRAGESTLIDTVLTEQDQTNAQIDLVLAENNYARTLTRLRFESGRLVSHDETGSAVTEEGLTGLPQQR